MLGVPLFAWLIGGFILYLFYLELSGTTDKPTKTEENINDIITNNVDGYAENIEDVYAIAEDIATGIDDKAADIGDVLGELIGGPGPTPEVKPLPIKIVHPVTGDVLENDVDDAIITNPIDDATMNTSTPNSGGAFVPTGEVSDSIPPAMEADILERHNMEEHIATMMGSNRDEVNMLGQGYIKVENRPAGLQDFSRDLNPYGTDIVELEAGLFNYSKPRYVGCANDSIRNPALPRSLGTRTVAECAQTSNALGYRVFGMQHGAGTGYGNGECRTGNDRDFHKYGAASSCELFGDNLLGGHSSNAIYYN